MPAKNKLLHSPPLESNNRVL